MGLPNINIIFTQKAQKAVQTMNQKVVALALADTAEGIADKAYSIKKASDIPAGISDANKDYIEKALIGYINKPKEVLVYFGDLTDALAYFAKVNFDYLAGPHDCTAEQAGTIADWVKAQWSNKKYGRAVLPNMAADFEGVINFATGSIVADGKTYTTAGYCSRIAGLICGTPANISVTSAPLPEVESVEEKTREELDAAVDAGKFVIWHDGDKVKAGRGVTSLVTTTPSKSAVYKKIKLVDLICKLNRDQKLLIEDEYIGKYPNTYDNKTFLLNAIREYLSVLADAAMITEDFDAEIDLDAQKEYLEENGVSTEGMDELAIKKALTGSEVFIRETVSLIDAIEDVTVTIEF